MKNILPLNVEYKDVTCAKLTLTPTRADIKLPLATTDQDYIDKIMTLAQLVQIKMPDIEVSYRGNFKISPKTGDFVIRMSAGKDRLDRRTYSLTVEDQQDLDDALTQARAQAMLDGGLANFVSDTKNLVAELTAKGLIQPKSEND